MAMTLLPLQAKAFRTGILIYTSQADPAGGRTETDEIALLSVERAVALVADINRALPTIREEAAKEAQSNLAAALTRLRSAEQDVAFIKRQIAAYKKTAARR